MSQSNTNGKDNQENHASTGREVGRTEHSWCKAVSSGTGITVLSLELSKPFDISRHQTLLQTLLISHPILSSKLHFNTSKKSFSFVIPSTPQTQSKSLDLTSTSQLLQKLSQKYEQSMSPLQMIHEYEMNENSWINPSTFPVNGIDVFFATVYELSGPRWVVALRFHTAVCDRTTAISLLRELPEIAGEVEVLSDGAVKSKKKKEVGVNLALEDLIPNGKKKKSVWAHGLDTLEYSVNSLRLTNLKFKDVKGPRCSAVVRLKISPNDTALILAGCKSREIKLCGVIAAAGLIAAASHGGGTIKGNNSSVDPQKKKYGVATLTDCRSILNPPLAIHHFGFYHSAVLNVYSVNGCENLWELATKCYTSFDNSKKSNKHITDMADLNFLMCRAIENPGLTASSSLRTSVISVFEDSVFDHRDQVQKDLGLEDYLGCASAHGVGPSLAVFDTIRDGQLDCACVYPSPLHSRQQMEELVDQMKNILVDATCQEKVIQK